MILKLLILILLLFLSGGSCFAIDTPSAEELYFEANRAFKEDRYQEAIKGYFQLIDHGYVNGHLYYNLGNAYFRAGQLGQAVLNYKRAQYLIPRDADLNFNLRYALDQTQDAISEDQNFLKQAFFWLDDLTFRELMWGFAALNILFWSILVLRLFVRPEWTYYVFIVLLIFWLVGGASLGVKWLQLSTDQRAVILAEEVDVLAGPDSNDTVLFKLHEGTTIHRERIEDGWSLIRLSKNKRGWIKSSAIEQVLKK
ncbi:BatE [Olavius sp. associated proteobacterium Delta 1]|nr:BatE [Olavius sp. associated proteobacterium Delta 1]